MRKLNRLNFPRLDVPQFQHVRIFRAVATVLRNDPTFARACQTFLCWEGAKEDTWEPAYSLCPYCRISPGPMASAMATERQHSAPLSVSVEVAVQGTDFDQLGNFWGLIPAAFWPQDSTVQRNTVQSYLQAAGVTRPVITMQAFGIAVDDDNNFMLVGRGNITFNSLLST